jgi:cobalamin biosynthesis protein CobD/CbiB
VKPVLRRVNPVFWMVRWADWFESRGVYVPGEDSRNVSTWRDFGWLIAGWLVAVSAFVVFFAVAS